MTHYKFAWLLLSAAFATASVVAGPMLPKHYSVSTLNPTKISSASLASNNRSALTFHDGKSFVRQNNILTPVTGLPPGGDILAGETIQVAGVNDAGQVAGFQEGRVREHAFLWKRNGCVDLGSLDGGNSWADALNNHAQVVGMSDAPGGHQHAFLWQSGKMQDIGLKIGGRDSEATAINDKGQVVGDMLPSGVDATLGLRYTFLYSARRATLLGVLPGDTASQANAINASGAVVGWSGHLITGQEIHRAFLCTSGKMYDLNKCIPAKSGWALYKATGINARGQIVGNGFFHGRKRAFLLTPQ